MKNYYLRYKVLQRYINGEPWVPEMYKKDEDHYSFYFGEGMEDCEVNHLVNHHWEDINEVICEEGKADFENIDEVICETEEGYTWEVDPDGYICDPVDNEKQIIVKVNITSPSFFSALRYNGRVNGERLYNYDKYRICVWNYHPEVSTNDIFTDPPSYIKSYFDFDNMTSMDNMFEDLMAYRRDYTIILPNFTGKNVTSARSAFSNAIGKELYMPSFTGENLTDVYHMFEYTSFDKIDLSSFTGENITDAHCMFSYCMIKDFEDAFPALNMQKIENAREMFSFTYLKSLEKLLSNKQISFDNTINMEQVFRHSRIEGHLDLSSLTNKNNSGYFGEFRFNYAFEGCSNLKSVDLSNFNVPEGSNKSTNFEDAFHECTSLEEVDLSSMDIHTIHTEHMFRNCSNLKKITCKRWFKMLYEDNYYNMRDGATDPSKITWIIKD